MENKRTPTLIVKRVIKAKKDRVFKAWSDPESMNKWFHPGQGRSIVTADFKTGGGFKNEMILDHGGTGDEKSYFHTGEYLEISPPDKLVFTWSSHLVTNTRVTVELREIGDSTELTLTHELLEDTEIRQRHNEGWDGCLANLASALEQ